MTLSQVRLGENMLVIYKIYRYARTLDVNPTQHKFFFQPKLSYPLSQNLYALLEMARIRILKLILLQEQYFENYYD